MSDADKQENELEGFENPNHGLDTYPVDSLLIRTEQRTTSDVLRRIERKAIKLDPDFQRDFVWGRDAPRQSRLIESILMRIPLPVFYLAEERDGRLIVVDGLQRLSTMQSFHAGELELQLPRSVELHGKRFNDLPQRLKDRFEDGQLTFYLIDSRVPDRVRLDIFERVNSGVPLTRQQMRNALYNGPATAFLKKMANSEPFKAATCWTLSRPQQLLDMRDREAVNRFLSFYLLGWERSPDWDFDDRLGLALSHYNHSNQGHWTAIEDSFLASMRANQRVFDDSAFRKPSGPGERRKPFNIAVFDVFSTLFAMFPEEKLSQKANEIRSGFAVLAERGDYWRSLSAGTTSSESVATRFNLTEQMLREVLGAQ